MSSINSHTNEDFDYEEDNLDDFYYDNHNVNQEKNQDDSDDGANSGKHWCLRKLWKKILN